MNRFTMTVFVFSVIAVFMVITIYNGLVYKRNLVRSAFSSIDVNLRKRHDLIPVLIDSVRIFAKHEEALFAHLSETRRRLEEGELSSVERFRLEEEVGPAVRRVLALAENYPELRSGPHFLSLHEKLTEIEEHLSSARRAYNAAVFEMNNTVESFPSNLVANTFGFQRHDYFEVGVGEQQGSRFPS